MFDLVTKLEAAFLRDIVLSEPLIVFDIVHRDKEPLTPLRGSFQGVGRRVDALVRTLEGQARECILRKQAPEAALTAVLESRSKV